MAQIRPFGPDDVQAVATLFTRVFRSLNSDAQNLSPALVQHIKEVYFGQPFNQTAPPGWLAEDAGRCVGFLGCFERQWRFGDRPLSVAVGSNFMVAPEVRDPFLASQLLRTMFRGPYQLCLTDTGNDLAWKLWKQHGGMMTVPASLHWFRLLRPGGFAVLGARERLHLGLSAEVFRPAAWVMDAVIGRPRRMPEGLRAEPITTEIAASVHVEEAQRAPLGPVYSVEQAQWLIGLAAKKSQYGPLHQYRLLDGNGNGLGWVLFYGRPGSVGQVLAIGARADRYIEVLSATHHLAHSVGCVALIGKVDRGRLREYSDTWSVLYHRSNYVLFRSEDREVREALLGGNAHLSRLEGDWWTRFQGEELIGPSTTASA